MKNSYVPTATEGVLDGSRVTSFKTKKKDKMIDVSMPLHGTTVVSYTGKTLILSLTSPSYDDILVAIDLIKEQVEENQFSIFPAEKPYCKVDSINATMIGDVYREFIRCTGVFAFESTYSDGSTAVTKYYSDDRLELRYIRDSYPGGWSKIVCAVDYTKMGINSPWEVKPLSEYINGCSLMTEPEYLLAYNEDWTVIGPSIDKPTKVFETKFIMKYDGVVFYLEDLNDGFWYTTLISPEDALSWMEKNVVVVCNNMKTLHDLAEIQPLGRRNKRPIPHRRPKLKKRGYVVDRYPEKYYRKGIKDARMGRWNTRSCRRIFINNNYVVLDWKQEVK